MFEQHVFSAFKLLGAARQKDSRRRTYRKHDAYDTWDGWNDWAAYGNGWANWGAYGTYGNVDYGYGAYADGAHGKQNQQGLGLRNLPVIEMTASQPTKILGVIFGDISAILGRPGRNRQPKKNKEWKQANCR